MNVVLNINSDAVVRHTAMLEKLRRSDLPIAIRGALNNAAFDVKTNTMPRSAEKAFITRNKNFFKANSSVQMAKGLNVNSMKSTVGFIEHKLRPVKSGKNRAVQELKQQEYGGTIGGRSYLPIDEARVGSSSTRPVLSQFRLSSIKNIVNTNKVKANSKKQKFIRAAFKSKSLYGDDSFVLGNIRTGGRLTLSKIDRISSNIKSKKMEIKRTPIYTYKKGFVAKIKPSKFMQRSSMESGLNIEHYFIEQARKRLEKLNV